MDWHDGRQIKFVTLTLVENAEHLGMKQQKQIDFI